MREEYSSRSEAMKHEKYLKAGHGQSELEKLCSRS